nr:hypothetical protein [Tanacetum cinerariifolium]
MTMDTTIDQQAAMDEALVPRQSFDEPPFKEEILAFILFLGYSVPIRTLTDVNINKLYQPWRSFAAIINKYLTGKSSGYDSLRLSQAQILWGLYHKRNVDYADLMWEDFVYQVEHKNQKKSNEMYYPRFTKVRIHHFMSKDSSIPRRNKFGALLPIELTNDEIRNSQAYKEYYAIATGEAAPKPKASARRARSGFDTSITPPTAAASLRLTAFVKGKQTTKVSKAKSLSALSKVAITEAQQLKLATKQSRQQMHISQASSFGADEGTGSIPGVPDVPTYESKEEFSWNSTEDEGADEEEKDDDDDEKDEGDDGEEGDGEEGDSEDDNDEDDDDEEGDDDEQEVVRDVDKKDVEESGDDDEEEGEDSEDKSDDEEDQGLNVGGKDMLKRRKKMNSIEMSILTREGTPTSVAPLPITTPTMTSSTIATTTTTSQAPILPTAASSDIIQHLPSFGSLFRFDDRQRSLEENFSKVMQTNQFAGASDRLHDEAQRENDEFLRTVDKNIKKIIKNHVKEQVKIQVSKFLPRIEQAVNEQLKTEVFTRSSHSSRTSYAVAADLSEMELKNILIVKIGGNKSIQCLNEQRNLYKALVDAYESDKIILNTYGETATLKRRRDDDEDKDEEHSAEPDQGSKRRREGKEPESAITPSKTTTRSTDRSTTRSISRQVSASESTLAEEPMQTTSQMEEPSHLEFDTGADDQPIIQSSQHLEWFSQPQKSPTSDRDWNKTLLVVHGSIQPVDTLTPKLLAGPTFELMKGSCKSLIELEYHLEEVYKATTDQLDWVNPEGASSHKYTTSVTKMKEADYWHIRWIEDLVPRTMWIQEPIDYDKHALWGVSHWGRKHQQFYSFAVNRESARDVYSKRRIIAVTELKIVEWHSYKHLDWITVRRDDDKLYKFKEGDFKRLCIQDIEDMLLLLEASTSSDVWKTFNWNKDKKNRLMRIDELHKFSDRTLTDVRTTLDNHLKGIQMQYLPQTIRRKSDKDRAAAMIQAIDKRLKTRRVMRNLESETVTHWFTLIALSALRCSDNENMLSLMNLILRSILMDLQVTPTKPG